MADILLVGVARLAARIQEPIETPEDITSAEELILSASDEARYYGLDSWTEATVPPVVKNVILGACQRAFQNPGFLESERADSVTLTRSDIGQMTVDFTPAEVKKIEQAAGKRRGFQSVPSSLPERLVPSSSRLRPAIPTVPIDSYADGAKPFPWV